MNVLLWTVLGFLSGAIPYSVLVGRIAGKRDIRQYGDHNPGAANVLRAAGVGWGFLALLLDALKGAIPVGIAWFLVELHGWQIVPVALAPIAGHAFSPFLKWQGGKAVAVTFGIWTGLTVGAAPTILGLLMGVFFATTSVSGWAVLFALLAFGGFLSLAYLPELPEFLLIWLGNLLLLAWKHRSELREPPRLRHWFRRKQ